MLEPKERKFAGYKQPYLKIHYELDFTTGAEVDIGCGTAAVGNGKGDADVSKSLRAHPLSMHPISYQFPIGRGDPSAGDPGHYPHRCPRYHRFNVTSPGNITFDTCASIMNVAVLMYKRVPLSESVPRMAGMAANFTFQAGLHFEVPLHNNDKQYRTVSTGLVPFQNDLISPGFVAWHNNPARQPLADYPPMNFTLKNNAFGAVNGCPLGHGAREPQFIIYNPPPPL